MDAGKDIATAHVILMFLVPSAVAALAPLLRVRCRPGTRICSYNFPLPEGDGVEGGGWAPSAVLEAPHHLLTDKAVAGSRKSTVYTYVA